MCLFLWYEMYKNQQSNYKNRNNFKTIMSKKDFVMRFSGFIIQFHNGYVYQL